MEDLKVKKYLENHHDKQSISPIKDPPQCTFYFTIFHHSTHFSEGSDNGDEDDEEDDGWSIGGVDIDASPASHAE